MADGLLDTNVIVHSLTNDVISEECRSFLRLVREGRLRVSLDPLVVHELTYTLQRVNRLSRSATADYFLAALNWRGVVTDRALLADALRRWRRTPGLGFVDAYLAARASQEGVAVLTKNVRELVAQGATVPNPLPGSDQS